MNSGDEETLRPDTDTVELLKRAMRAFRGGFAVVSHSEKLIEEAAGGFVRDFFLGQNLWLFDIIYWGFGV